jgi:hypothetical protein
MSANDQIILGTILDQKRAELAPTLPPSAFFEVFVAEQVLKDYDLSYDELHTGAVGEGGDGGIDGLYVFVNGDLVQEDTDFGALKKDVLLELVIIQAKTSPSFNEAALDKLIAVTEDLLDLSHALSDYKAVYNEGVRSAIGLFRRAYEALAARFPKLRFRYVYASRGLEVHPNVRRKADVLRDKVKGLFSAADYDFAFLGAAELLTLARRAPLTSHQLTLAESPISSTGDVGFICLVRLRDFNAFITDDAGHLRRHLFESNVRDYQGGTQVNEEIQSSLQDRGREDFWWLNNGITIVASKATQSGKMLTIEDPQIVNGLQTSTEIYNYFQKLRTDGDERNLLVRIIVPAKAESRDRIIKATNSQTYIPPASLRATDKVQRDIEEYLAPFGLYYDRRKNYYKNEGKPVDQVVSISAMAQAVMAVALRRPDTARARPSSLLKDDSDYRRLFDPTHALALYRVCITLVRRVEAVLRADTKLSAKDRNNLRYYAALHLAGGLLGRQQPSAQEIAGLDPGKITAEAVEKTVALCSGIYATGGSTDQFSKGPEFLQALEPHLGVA